MATLGYIGLGLMGGPMAEHLLGGGHTVRVFDVNADAVQALAGRGATACASPAEVARGAEVVFTCLPATHVSEQVLFGEDGVAAGAAPGTIVVEMSTVPPTAVRAWGERLAAQGVELLDAPVSGGDVGAREATLTIMAGGREQTFSAVRPYLELLGKNINLVGEAGAGAVAKTANQIIVNLTIQAVGEALLFASRAGADPAAVRQALLGGFAQSRILELHGERMIQRNFVAGGRVDINSKDLDIALEDARTLQVPLPATALVRQLYNAVWALPEGRTLDHSALVRAIEDMARHTIA